jgi:hypothetical protein
MECPRDKPASGCVEEGIKSHLPIKEQETDSERRETAMYYGIEVTGYSSPFNIALQQTPTRHIA